MPHEARSSSKLSTSARFHVRPFSSISPTDGSILPSVQYICPRGEPSSDTRNHAADSFIDSPLPYQHTKFLPLHYAMSEADIVLMMQAQTCRLDAQSIPRLYERQRTPYHYLAPTTTYAIHSTHYAIPP